MSLPEIGTGPPLADVTDVAHALHLDPTSLNAADVSWLIDRASDMVRAELGQLIHAVTDDVVTLPGPGADKLFLPELPVDDVTVVKAWDGTALTTLAAGDWRPMLGHDGRLGIVRRIAGRWPLDDDVEVTYSHGYHVAGQTSGVLGERNLPGAIQAAVVRVVIRGYTNPTGKRQEQIGRYGYTVGGSDAGLYLTTADKSDLDDYRPGRVAGSK